MKYYIIILLSMLLFSACKKDVAEKPLRSYVYIPPLIAQKLIDRATTYAIINNYWLLSEHDSLIFYREEVALLPADTALFKNNTVLPFVYSIVYNVYAERANPSSQDKKNEGELNHIFYDWQNYYSGSSSGLGGSSGSSSSKGYSSLSNRYTMPYGVNPFAILTVFKDTTGGRVRELGRLYYPYDPGNRLLFSLSP